ncbi:hypothetical protein P3342_001755 [Pyrenophora teres f. teres]|nr:hypothetical protein P3342_001755 [Pyrenophora teres f. teres]
MHKEWFTTYTADDKNFASAVAKWDVEKGGLRVFASPTRPSHAQWTRGIDRARHVADSKERYEQYFELLHSKMQQYEVAAENVYNMDEKGFMIGITARSKRVFTRAIWEQKERTAAIQDGNREWVTILACICGDGSSLPPALIYEGKAGIQSSWVSELQAEIHEVFVANSTSGWTNNELGLAWLEQILTASRETRHAGAGGFSSSTATAAMLRATS